ncbi:MAG: hypothetical protein KAJ23_04810 [Maribacter sp.]|nr:hypothetical protein [Maribacter sp.]
MKELQIIHKDKILFPQSGITKNDLIHYYEQIADYHATLSKRSALDHASLS